MWVPNKMTMQNQKIKKKIEKTSQNSHFQITGLGKIGYMLGW